MPMSRWLAGFMDDDHFRQRCAGMALSDPADAVLARWEEARRNLAAAVLHPPRVCVRPVGDELAEHLCAVSDTQLFRAQTANRNWSFAWCDVRHAVSLQESVNLDYARTAAARAAAGSAKLVELCLPRNLRPPGQTYHVTGTAEHDVTFHSEDLNLIVMRAALEPCVTGDEGDPSIARLGFVIGKASHHIHVLAVGDRCYLKNGYHRAVGLAEVGVHELPCVLLRADELGDGECERWSRRLLTSTRPPLVGDFLDAALTVDVPQKRMVKVIHARVQPMSSLEVREFEMAMPGA